MDCFISKALAFLYITINSFSIANAQTNTISNGIINISVIVGFVVFLAGIVIYIRVLKELKKYKK